MLRMKYRVVVSVRAQADLRSVLDYLSVEAGPRVAVGMVDKLTAATDELGDKALRFALAPQHEETGVRRRVVGRYNIYYRVKDETVTVLTFLHHARDSERVLFPDD